MPFTFNAVELCVLIINEKPWTRAREVCRAREYDAKTSKTANIIKANCSPENITQKYQMSSVHATCTPINWPKDSQKYDTFGVCQKMKKKRQKNYGRKKMELFCVL